MPEASPFSLRGKVVVQFGGTGLLGRALVSALRQANATLIVASRDRAALQKAIGDEQPGDTAVEVEQVDIADESSLCRLRDRVLAIHGRIDGVVFNAVSRPMRSFGDDLNAWKASMETNATGMFATSRVFGDAMALNKSGSLVHIASQMGLVGMQPWLYGDAPVLPPPDYFFHKGGMINLTRYLASHYGAANVRVNVVSPGGIYNPNSPPSADFLHRYAKMTMLGRMAHAEEIGCSVIFLLSNAATYITGANLSVDGGYTAK